MDTARRKHRKVTFRLNDEWYEWFHQYCTVKRSSLQQQIELMLEQLKAKVDEERIKQQSN
jgi:hypothetical protein